MRADVPRGAARGDHDPGDGVLGGPAPPRPRADPLEGGRQLYGQTFNIYSPACPSWEKFTTKAYFNPPEGGKDPTTINCLNAEAVACVAEASDALSKWGVSSVDNIRSWLGPCCCVTDADRAVLEKQDEFP